MKELELPARIALAMLAVAAPSAGQPGPAFKVVAVQGWFTPSISPVATHGILGGLPHIAASGHVSFGGFVGNNGSANYAVWSGIPGNTPALAVAGDPTPGRTGETLNIFDLSSSSDYWPCSNGTVAFACRTTGSNHRGIWFGKPGSLAPVAIVQDPVPTLPDSTIRSFPGLVFVANGAGAVLVRAMIEGGSATAGDDSGIWLIRDGQPPALIAREGDPAPGTEPGTTYKDFTFATLSMNAVGQVCFANDIDSGNLVTNRGIFAGPPGELEIVVRKGFPIPILPGFTWDGIGKPRINKRGDVVFEAVPKPNGKKGFFVRYADGSLARIAEDGEAAPGADGRAWSGSFFNQPLIAGAFCAFKGGLEEQNSLGRDGIWIHERGEGTRLVAKADDPAPGLTGETFDTFDAPSLNALGMVAFTAVTQSGTRGLWLYHQGTVRLLVAVGGFLEVGFEDIRRVAAIGFRGESSSQSGYRSALNDAGQLVFQTSFNTGALGTAIHHVELWDHDGGGVNSLLEEAFGGDPSNAADDFSNQPGISAGAGEVVVSYRRRTDGSFAYEVQSSSNFSEWEPAAGSTVLASDQTGVPAGIERVEFRKAIAAGSRLSFRVKVTRL